MGSVTAIGTRRGVAEPTVREAVDEFLAARRNTNPNTQRSYSGTLGKVATALGPNRRLSEIAGDEIGATLIMVWGETAPSTWNQRRAAVGAWLAWCADKKHWDGPQLPADSERRREKGDSTQSVDAALIDRLCKRTDIPVRERCLWRMLYESASRASAVLALDIGDLDTANRRARIVQKGGDVLWIHWGTDTARLLPHVIGGRTEGPLFLSDRKPGPQRRAATAARDLDPETGRVRMSYDRARILLGKYSGGLRLHQLRHSSATHLAEAGVSTAVIMAKTGHKSLRSLQRYVRPGAAAVAEATELLSSPTRRG